MRSIARPFKYLLVGLAVDVATIESLFLLIFREAILTYDGGCPADFFMNYAPCSFPRYVEVYFGFWLLGIVFAGWWIYSLALLLPPVIALIIGCATGWRDAERA
jgi:hypothetical protein